MKVEKMAKNGEKGQNCYPLSPRLLLRIRASATFEPRPHAVVTLTGLRCVPCARCRFFSSFCLKVFGSGLSKIFLYHVYVFLEFLENMTFCVFP